LLMVPDMVSPLFSEGKAPNRNKCLLDLLVASVFSVFLAVALFYATLEAPYILDRILLNYFPDIFWEFEERERFLNYVRPIGYVSLLVVIILIILGFIYRKHSISATGSVATYLPIFGYFAYAMFFLAGIGVIRVLWLPILDVSPNILRLGHIVLSPYWLLWELFRTYSDPETFLLMLSLLRCFILCIIFVGILIFVFGSTTWLYGKFRGYDIIDFWIYRYSRHPQYLGYIVWSYGVLSLVLNTPHVRGAFHIPPSPIWVVSTMIIIGVALHEEIDMLRLYGKKYEEYQKRTPFLVPLPRSLLKVLLAPSKIITKNQPRNSKEILAVLAIYTAIIFLLSYIFISLSAVEW